MHLTVTDSTTALDLLSWGAGVECPTHEMPVLEAAARAIPGASGQFDWSGTADWMWVAVGDREAMAERRGDAIVAIEVTGLRAGEAVQRLRAAAE